MGIDDEQSLSEAAEEDNLQIVQGDLLEWIRILRGRSHRHGNAITSTQGEVLRESMRIDDAFKDIGRIEGRDEQRDKQIDALNEFKAFTKGAMAVLVLLFPMTVGVIVALLKG